MCKQNAPHSGVPQQTTAACKPDTMPFIGRLTNGCVLRWRRCRRTITNAAFVCAHSRMCNQFILKGTLPLAAKVSLLDVRVFCGLDTPLLLVTCIRAKISCVKCELRCRIRDGVFKSKELALAQMHPFHLLQRNLPSPGRFRVHCTSVHSPHLLITRLPTCVCTTCSIDSERADNEPAFPR